MKKITLVDDDISLNFLLNKNKVLFCDNVLYYHMISKVFSNYFRKKAQSEYAIEYNKKINIYLNDAKLNLSEFNFFEISDDFNIDEDIKAGSKSLTLQYLNTIFSEIEYNDDYQNILTLLTSLAYEYNDDVSDMLINLNPDLSLKSFIKLFYVNILKNDLETNILDYSYNDIIILQLQMISVISKNCNKNILIFIKIPFITEEISSYINDLDCLIILLTNNAPIGLNNIYLINDNVIIDLDNEEEVYNLFMKANHNYDTSEKLKQHLMDKYINSRK